MEEYVTRLVENTFKNHDIEEVKEIVIERMLYYEMKLLNSVSKDKIKEKIKELEQDMVLKETRQVLKELLEE